MSEKIYTNDIDDEMVEILKEDEDVVKCYFEEACQDTYKKAKELNRIQRLSYINDLIGITNKKKWGKLKINDTVKIEAQLLSKTENKFLFELFNTNGILCHEKEKLNLAHHKMRTYSNGFQETSAEPINKNDPTYYVNLRCSKYGNPEYYEYYGKIILAIEKADNTNNEWYNNNFMKNITLYLQE
jgi:enoyl reductase-like protein